MNGVLPLYKERGMTSFDCIRRLRQLLQTKKIGHSGTLDPNVSGVLPICIGSATKLVPYLMASGKVYAGELIIGQSTTTEDLDGEIVDEKVVAQPFSSQQIQAAMQELTGTIIQVPPMYSAVKVNGKRLYEYARAGETVNRPQREVTIEEFKLLADYYDAKHQRQRVRFEVTCSKGTYVRTLAVDLAKKLGFPGTMAALTRLKSGGFELDQTLSLDDIKEAVNQNTIENYIFPARFVLKDYPQVPLSSRQWKLVQNGGWLKVSELQHTEKEIVLLYDEQAKAIYQKAGADYKPATMISVK
ncbi:tRNA pseudouridine(55) synthase TruB [uncultured Limosilactobacillus sp.]|uniref:tRNA pseudouridine(55) synthase TruB n=1 Tax=uncultured Limosilactobacillus sp. TaxID=2837629 RepID=UPI0025CD9977|nr:tRNA pseudouridine(55) synthase TruB [uncultured Limosilactobacillus sp.]